MTPRSRRRASAAIALTGLLALVAACGDDDDSSAATSAASTVAEGGATATTTPGDGTGSTTATTAAGEPSDTTATTTGATAPTGLSADEDGYTTAIAAYLQSPSGLSVTPEQAECAAPGWVDTITVDRLQAADQQPDTVAGGLLQTTELGLEEDEAQVLLDGLVDCGVDLRELFFSSFGDQPEKDCIDAELSDEFVEQILREAFVYDQPSEELDAEIQRVGDACGLNG